MSWCCVHHGDSSMTMHYDLSLQEQRSTTWTELKNSDRDLSIYFRSWSTSIAESNRELVYPASIQAWAEKHSSSVVILQVLLTPNEFLKKSLYTHPFRTIQFDIQISTRWTLETGNSDKVRERERKSHAQKKPKTKKEETKTRGKWHYPTSGSFIRVLTSINFQWFDPSLGLEVWITMSSPYRLVTRLQVIRVPLAVIV